MSTQTQGLSWSLLWFELRPTDVMPVFNFSQILCMIVEVNTCHRLNPKAKILYKLQRKLW